MKKANKNKNIRFTLNRQRSVLTGSGQATIEYFVLFAIFASLTFLGASKFREIASFLNSQFTQKATDAVKGYPVNAYNWKDFE